MHVAHPPAESVELLEPTIAAAKKFNLSARGSPRPLAKSPNPFTIPYTLVLNIISNTTTHCVIIAAMATLHPTRAHDPKCAPHTLAASS